MNMNIQCKDFLLERYNNIPKTHQFHIDPKNQPHEKVQAITIMFLDRISVLAFIENIFN